MCVNLQRLKLNKQTYTCLCLSGLLQWKIPQPHNLNNKHSLHIVLKTGKSIIKIQVNSLCGVAKSWI